MIPKHILIIQSASRSPPGQISNSDVQFKSSNEFTFRATFRVRFCTFGIILEVLFDPGEHFRGAVRSFLRPKTAQGTESVPRAAKEAPPPKYTHPFGDLVDFFVCTFHMFY